MKLGIISDTHGYLDPRVEEIFAGVDHILHGGDVGPYSLLAELELIAPVTAVLGNTDTGIDLRLTEITTLGGRKFLVQHIVNPHSMDGDLLLRLASEKPKVIIFGHTHKPFSETMGGILFFNPGYAGPQRFKLERSVALLHCNEKGIRHQYVTLD